MCYQCVKIQLHKTENAEQEKQCLSKTIKQTEHKNGITKWNKLDINKQELNFAKNW